MQKQTLICELQELEARERHDLHEHLIELIVDYLLKKYEITELDRRQFAKLAAACVALPALPTKHTELPEKFTYRGFEFELSSRYDINSNTKQLFWSNGKYCGAVIYDSQPQWEQIRPDIDKAINRCKN